MKIPVVTYWSDGKDGGGSLRVYNTLDELRENLFKPDEWTTKEDCQKRFQSALDGDNPYEDGEIGETELEIEALSDGSMKLAKSFYVHYGQ